MRPRARLAALAGVLLGALLMGAGCSSTDKPKPKPLEPVAKPIAGRQVWSQRVEGAAFPLSVATAAGTFVVAGGDGTVLALQADSGREVWRGNAGAKLSAGVGSDGRFAAVVTRDGDLVVLDGGKLAWKKPLGVRVTTAPLVAGERVFVLGADRSVNAFDALDGRRLWTLARQGDPLTLSQQGVLVPFKDTLVVGLATRLTGLDPLRGTVRWEATIAAPRGTNEVERLADLVGPPARVGSTLCVRAFQASVGCVNAERGTLVWSKPGPGTEGVAADDQVVVGADASDRVSAWKAGIGESAWVSEKLLYRGLGAPVAAGKTIVFGDAEGLVHWLARDNGDTLLRLPTDGSAIVAAPVVSGTTMLVVTRKGGLFAFRPE